LPLEPDLANRLEKFFASLTKSQRRIARFINENYEIAAFLSAADLAAITGVSDATVIRFAQALGYETYTNLKKALRDSIRPHLNPEVKLEATISEIGTQNIFQKVARTEIGYLNDAIETVHEEDILTAARWINKARRVFILGYGLHVSLVDMLTFRLSRFGIDVVPGIMGGRDIFETIHQIKKEDCVLAFSFVQPREEIILALKKTGEIGAPRIIISDTPASEVRALSDVFIMARRGPLGVFHSLAIPNIIVNALILAVAALEPEKCLGNLEGLSNLRKKMGYDPEHEAFILQKNMNYHQKNKP